MNLLLHSSGDFFKYISVYVAILAICSTAFFVFLLPKVYDYFNNLKYRNYKEMLDLRKTLADNNRTIDRRIEKMIDHYEKEFIEARQDRLWNTIKSGFFRSALALLGFNFLVIAISLLASLIIYAGWLWLINL